MVHRNDRDFRWLGWEIDSSSSNWVADNHWKPANFGVESELAICALGLPGIAAKNPQRWKRWKVGPEVSLYSMPWKFVGVEVAP